MAFKPTKYKSDLPINQGGLMRCCIQSLAEAEFDAYPSEGDSLECKYCHTHMIVLGLTWQWDPED